MADFKQAMAAHEAWFAPILNAVKSNESISADHIQDITAQVKDRETNDELHRIVKELTESPLTSDVATVRDELASVERGLTQLKDEITAREVTEQQRSHMGSQFEESLSGVVAWLDAQETCVERLEPLSVNVDVIASQTQELQVCCGSYMSFYEFGSCFEHFSDNIVF